MKDVFDTLRPATKKWIRSLDGRFVLEDFHLRLLALAGASWDRAVAARKQIEKEGMSFRDRFGQVRAHPCVQIESQAIITFCRVLRETGLDLEKNELPKPPNPGGY